SKSDFRVDSGGKCRACSKSRQPAGWLDITRNVTTSITGLPQLPGFLPVVESTHALVALEKELLERLKPRSRQGRPQNVTHVPGRQLSQIQCEEFGTGIAVEERESRVTQTQRQVQALIVGLEKRLAHGGVSGQPGELLAHQRRHRGSAGGQVENRR